MKIQASYPIAKGKDHPDSFIKHNISEKRRNKQVGLSYNVCNL